MDKPCKRVQLEPDLLKSLIELGRNDFLFPVNVNTVLGMRGLTAMFEVENEKRKELLKKAKRNSSKVEIKPEKNPMTQPEHHQALDLFKMRFNSMFKQTATLAKMHRTVTSVSLRPKNKKRKGMRFAVPTSTVTSSSAGAVAASATTTDFHNNETLVRISAANEDESDGYTMSETDEKPCRPNRVTVLESITVGLNQIEEVDPLELPSTTVVSNDSYNYYTRYRVEQSDRVQEINIQPSYVSGSETDGLTDDTYSNTEFVIWTPTVTDEATGSQQ